MVPNSQYVSICLLVASFRVGNKISEKFTQSISKWKLLCQQVLPPVFGMWK